VYLKVRFLVVMHTAIFDKSTVMSNIASLLHLELPDFKLAA